MPLLRFAFDWVKWSLPWLAAAVLLVLAIGHVRQKLDVPISFLVGPRGGDGANQTKILQAEFDDHPSLGRNYFVTPVYTDGFVDNYRQVDADSKGRVVGYAMDGLPDGRAANVQAILPMEWEYLHFLIRTDSLKKIGVKWPDAATNGIVSPIQFSTWAAGVRLKHEEHKKSTPGKVASALPIRVYLGPRGSGTRSVAEAVLEFAKVSIEEVEAIGIADFQELLPAMRQKEIDGAFYVGPLGAGTARRIAEDAAAGCTLVSIDIAEKLAKKHLYLTAGTIPAGTYSVPGDDHLDEVMTLAVRRVLVASKLMDANHAFRIAQHVQNALSHRVPKRLPNGQYPGPSGNSPSAALIFDDHRGMWSTDSGSWPLSWLDRNAFWVVPLLLTMVVAVIGAWKTDIVNWLDRHRPSSSAPPDSSSDRAGQASSPEEADITAEIARILKAMHDAEDDLIVANRAATKEVLDDWRRQIGDVYRRIHATSSAKKMTAAQSLALKEGAYQLQQELEFLRDPPWHTPPSRKRRESTSRPKGGPGDKSNEGDRR